MNPQALLLAELEKGPSYGLELVERTGLSMGCVYRNLRLLEQGLQIEEWPKNEQCAPVRLGRPRTYYRLAKP